MKAIRFAIHTLTTTIFIATLAATGNAQPRVFVSGTGNDANPCTRTSPCRNFQRGHDLATAGGEVVALDSAGYGVVTITKSVTITGQGVMAGISALSGNAVTIATAGITVNLRSLTIEGLGSGTSGINATDFSVLHVENCIVNGFANTGILVSPSAAGSRKLFIEDSISSNNTGTGIFLNNNNGGTVLTATIARTRAENNSLWGIRVLGAGAIVTAHRCQSSGNSFAGFSSELGAVLNIESSVASNNDSAGIETTATVRVSDSTVTNNTGFGFLHAGGTFESRENNTVAGNNGGGVQTDGTITSLTAL